MTPERLKQVEEIFRMGGATQVAAELITELTRAMAEIEQHSVEVDACHQQYGELKTERDALRIQNPEHARWLLEKQAMKEEIDRLRAELAKHERLKAYLTRKNTPEEDALEAAEVQKTRASATEEIRREMFDLLIHLKNCNEGGYKWVEMGLADAIEFLKRKTAEPVDPDPVTYGDGWERLHAQGRTIEAAAQPADPEKKS